MTPDQKFTAPRRLATPHIEHATRRPATTRGECWSQSGGAKTATGALAMGVFSIFPLTLSPSGFLGPAVGT
jgi:hypothetical protein